MEKSNKYSKYLDELEELLDEEQENDLFNEWTEFCDKGCGDKPFSPKRNKTLTIKNKVAHININTAFKDVELMFLRELEGVQDQLINGGGSLLSIRTNYGTGIIPSLFDSEFLFLDDKADTLPSAKPLGADKIKELLDKGVPDTDSGLGEDVFEAADFFMYALENYPKLTRFIHIYHPDIQGPMDIAELIWGSQIFTDALDQPDLVKQFLDLVNETYIEFMDRWLEVVPRVHEDYSVHWGWLHRGTILLRDDSAVNFSPDMFDEFIGPWDEKLLKKYDGGCIHFCGKGDHFIENMSRLKGLNGINTSQPHLNDINKIAAATIDKGIRLYSLNPDELDKITSDNKGLIHLYS